MAVAGRKPAASGQTRHRVKPSTEWTEVLNAPYTGEIPELPPSRTVITRDGQEQVDLQPLTAKWWESVTTMPHCVLWAPSDWMFALTTATVADAAFCGISSAATELRNREKVMGTTVEFRRDLRIRYVDAPAAVESAEVTNIADYRDL
jgi:hypothetical protein